MNLVSNSIKFTFQGYIKISVMIIRKRHSEMVEFEVEDTGIGIKKEDQSKLFKMFGMIPTNKRINPNG